MKFPLLVAAVLPLFGFSAFAAAPSPVGTWEVNLAGADQGTVYVTFEEDQDFTAYGISRDSNGLFTLAGTWSVDEKGLLNASYTEWIDGEDVTGTITGKVTAKKIAGKIAATNGNFSFKGTPEQATQDLAGDWTGTALLPRKIRISQAYAISATELPHVFQINGSGEHPVNGTFAISGTAIAGSRGKVRIHALSTFPSSEAPGITNAAGKVNASRGKGTLKGLESTGQKVKIALRR